MTPEEMRSSSAAKVKQVMDLMNSLNITVQARQRLTQDGFLDLVVFYVDNEQYPSPAPEGAEKAQEEVTPAAQPEVAPAGGDAGSDTPVDGAGVAGSVGNPSAGN